MGDRPFGVGVETDGEGPTESDRGQRDVVRGVFSFDRALASGGRDQLIEHVASDVASFGPAGIVEQRVHDVDRAETAIDRSVQIPTQRVASGGRLLERGSTFSDRTVQDLEGDGSQQLLPVREVSVQRGNPHACTFGHGVSGRLAAGLEHEVDRRVEDRLPVPTSISAHGRHPDSLDSTKRSIFLHLAQGHPEVQAWGTSRSQPT